VGSGLTVLAFLAIRSYLREAGEERWSVLALPFIVMASTLFAFLPAMEIAALTAALMFEFGVRGFAMGIVSSGALSPRFTWLVVGALVVMAATRFVPAGAALCVGGRDRK
jgi:hypothetical protein